MFWKKIKTQQQLDSGPSHVSYLMFPRSPVLAWKGSPRSCRQSHSSYFCPEEWLVRVLDNSPHRSILIVWHAPLLNFSYWLEAAADWTDLIHHKICFEFHAGVKTENRLNWSEPNHFQVSHLVCFWFHGSVKHLLFPWLIIYYGSNLRQRENLSARNTNHPFLSVT